MTSFWAAHLRHFAAFGNKKSLTERGVWTSFINYFQENRGSVAIYIRLRNEILPIEIENEGCQVNQQPTLEQYINQWLMPDIVFSYVYFVKLTFSFLINHSVKKWLTIIRTTSIVKGNKSLRIKSFGLV